MKFSGRWLILAMCIGGAALLPAPNALCGPKDGKGAQEAGHTGGKRKTTGASAKRSLRMEEIEIYGDVEKPKTMFVIPRSGLKYSRKDEEKDFTNEILDPMTKQWVEDTQRWRVAVPPP